MFNLAILLVVLFVQNTVGKDVTVQIKNGPITGFQRSFDGRPQDTFLGIPFAQPPTGDLRFRKPLPMTGWSEPIEAKEWPNNCWQPKLPYFDDEFINKNFSEDCLYLNVFTRTADSENLKPVLLFFPNMGLSVGGSSHNSYDPIVLVDRNDVVVVTFNSRLNIFGFLFTDTDDAPGNQGMYDEALAIEWVKDNIKYFGGDPEMITLFGQQGGAWSVGLHILSPMTRNLFKNAMLMSGSPMSDNVDGLGYAIITREASKSFTKEVLDKVGCGKEINDKSIACIKKMDLDVFSDKFPDLYMKWSWVITGDQFLHQMPNELLDAGDHKKNSQIIVGFMEDEGGVTLNYNIPEWFDTKSVKKITKQTAYESLKKVEETNVINENVDVNDVAKYYLLIVGDDDSDGIEKQLGIAIGDGWTSCPSFNFVRRLYKNDRNNTKVFGYFWSHKFPNSVADDWINKHCEPQMGACLFTDLYPMFGHPFKPENRFSDRDRRMSDQMMQMLASFSRNGQPSPINGVEWPSFFTIKDKTLTPLYEFGPTDETSGFKYNINGLECDVIWKS